MEFTLSMADAATLIPVPSQQRHSLSQIAASGTHRLVLKQWLKEEGLLERRVMLRESRLDDACKEIAFLYCAFHIASVLVLFISASVAPLTSPSSSASYSCRRSWIPCLVSLLSSLAML